VVAVAPSPSLPEAVNLALAENLRKLRFEPALRDGHVVPGVTYARQEACAVPTGGSYNLAVRFLGNGPGILHGGPTTIRFPLGAHQAGASAQVKLTYVVQPDGKVVVESADLVSKRGPNARDFVTAARDWLESQRSEAEQLDGQPVATRVSFTMVYKSGGPTFTGINAREQAKRHVEAEAARRREASIASSSACALASSAEDAPQQHVALTSPFRLMQAN
jgi:hypothetical protein